MTRDEAIAGASAEAERCQRSMTVYRFPAWRNNVYGVRATDDLPREALTFETFKVGDPIPAPPVVEPIEQGSLF